MSKIQPPPGSSDHQDLLASSLSASYAGVVAFITVANEGSFSRAADRLGIGRSAVSRSVQKLEGQIGARLFCRTTRATSITREGELFYQNCRPGVDQILQALEEMRDLREGPPQGRLKISAPHGFGRKVVAPLLAEFRARFPAVTLELLLDEGTVDFATDGFDVAFRDGRLDDSQIIAKQLIPMQMHVCASPRYASQHGLPDSVDDLVAHSCINQRLASGRLQSWDFKVDGQKRSITPDGAIVVNDPELAMRAVLDNQGLAQLPAYQASEALRDGALVACLEQDAPDDRGHYLCYLSRQQLPKRIRAFIDFMTTSIRALDLCGIELTAQRIHLPAAADAAGVPA
ncbi:LysR family transcriptional regulator [Rhodanobacter lindaniclasticus]|uniref:LysR family transcriptional regulator n=1 Tax=Rhodanobacter lindaniclasticus TaxID=75310 RepID=A0A4S3KL11_9GAMM|nr:LysR family transcriptional regulator [Rhodanobacter lindaniclasticus]THD09466.1 LysR family transcriptional regulator [Rhodanobacter lindaniclasticus]